MAPSRGTAADGWRTLDFDPFEQPKESWLVGLCGRLGPIGFFIVLIARCIRANFEYAIEVGQRHRREARYQLRLESVRLRYRR
jgi:hypothetical protein